jgi:hypothetical protein
MTACTWLVCDLSMSLRAVSILPGVRIDSPIVALTVKYPCLKRVAS